VVRPLLAFVLLASGLKLVNMGTGALGWTMLIVAIVGLAIWGAIDGLSFKREVWEAAGINRKTWLSWETLGAFFGVGAVAAVVYFLRVRPQLVMQAHAVSKASEAIVVPEAEPTPAL
jgi:hypothetical protein